MTAHYLEITVDKFIFRVKEGLLYTENGLWVTLDEASQTARLGLSDYAQQANGDVAFVTLPEPGDSIRADGELATIETIKVDMELPAPFDGEVVAVNQALEDEPELINQDPYGAGWLVELKPAQWPVGGFLDAQAYLAVMTEQAQTEAAR